MSGTEIAVHIYLDGVDNECCDVVEGVLLVLDLVLGLGEDLQAEAALLGRRDLEDASLPLAAAQVAEDVRVEKVVGLLGKKANLYIKIVSIVNLDRLIIEPNKTQYLGILYKIMSKNKIELTPQIDVDAILSEMSKKYSKEDISTIDGVKIDFEKEWVHLRKSNTEPIIRIYTESGSQESADELALRFIEEIKVIAGL